MGPMWRMLLQSWIQQQAREKVYESVRRAADSQVKTPADEPLSPPPPADVGLVFALGVESGGLIDLLDGVLTTPTPRFTVRQGGCRGRSVVLIESGMGCILAAQATEMLIAAHHPPWIISAGFAGAVNACMQRGDLVLVNYAADMHGNGLAIDVRMSPEELKKHPGLHVGRVITADKIVRTREEKLALGEQFQSLALDMETYAVAEVCRQHKVKFLALRVISDTVDDELPVDIENLARQRTVAAQLGAAASAIWKRPSSVKQMWQLKEAAIVGSDRLAKFLVGMIPQLAPERKKIPETT